MGKITTVQLAPETRQRLAQLKQAPRETHDELLNELLDLAPVGDEEGGSRPAFRAGLLHGRLDIWAGRTIGHEELKRRRRP